MSRSLRLGTRADMRLATVRIGPASWMGHGSCALKFMHLASDPAKTHLSNPFHAGTDLGDAVLARLYDNNCSPRNRGDLAQLRQISASNFAGSHRTHVHVFGQAPHERADVFMPRTSTFCPAVFFVHGGRWRLNDSSTTAFWAGTCVAHGVAFVSLNFRKLGQASLCDIVSDVDSAVAVLLDAAPGLGINPDAVVLAGHSSGAHLALCAALGQPGDGIAVMRPPRWATALQAIYLLGGIYDLLPLLRTAMPKELGFDSLQAQAMSPLLHLMRAIQDDAAVVLPPVRVAVGACESTEFIRQAQALHWALARLGQSEFHAIPGAAHFDAALEFNAPDSASRDFVLRQLFAGRTA